MYIVFIKDYKNHILKSAFKSVNINEAYDMCEKFARDFVNEKEGEGRKFASKKNLPFGYSAVKTKTAFCKYTIFHREKNGYIYNGKISKLFSFFVVKDQINNKVIDNNYETSMEFEYQQIFNRCLEDIETEEVEIEVIEEYEEEN